MIILETPWTSKQIALYARKNGKYTRPIIGHMIDIRVEDIIPPAVRKNKLNIIAKLPDIPEFNQVGVYLIANGNTVDRTDLTKDEAAQYLQSGEYILLPDSPNHSLWQYTKSPWWEYAFALDEYDAYVKAPKQNRSSEPSAEDIDEQIDNYAENHGKINAMSPLTIIKLRGRNNSDMLKARLNRV